MFPGLPRAFPNQEWSNVEDIFRVRPPPRPLGARTPSPEEAWVEQELRYYKSEFTTVEELHVCVTTFNVGCKKPMPPLHALCVPSLATDTQRNSLDLIVVALQEIDMSASAMFREETEAALPWVQALYAAIGASNERQGASTPFYAFPHKQLVGLMLCVFVRRPLLKHVNAFSINTEATGAMGSIGNKGAVGVHLDIHCTKVCIITAHLAAGQGNISKRNENINTILTRMDFNAARRAELQVIANTGVSGVEATLQSLPELFPRDHDITIVAGDLNYRLNLSYEDAVSLASKGDIPELLKHDQLVKELESPHTPWGGFVDLTPTFLPTYRFDVGTSTYDTSDKHRIPSFTDRILVWCRRPSMRPLVKVDSLTAVMQVMSSDHKPVQAMLRLPVLVEVPEQKACMTQKLMEKVKSVGLGLASCGNCTISRQFIDFGRQQYHACGTKETVTLTNTGNCAAVVHVVRQRGRDDSEGAWLRVSPMECMMAPGESQEVDVETLIDPRCMSWLAHWRPYDGRGRIALKSRLLFCVRNGPVHAVECVCQLLPSIFGNSLESIMLLDRLPCLEAYQRKEDIQQLLQTLRPQVPKEVWYMTDILMRNPRTNGLFTTTTSSELCHNIMARLDSEDGPLPLDTDVHCVAECLLTFLKNLQEPVVPFAMYNAALAAGRSKGKAPVAFVRQLPTVHANLWLYTLALLNFLLRPMLARFNELTADVLSQIFSTALIIRPTAAQGLDYVRLLQGGGVNQQVRQQLQQERDDARALVQYFLATPPALLQF